MLVGHCVNFIPLRGRLTDEPDCCGVPVADESKRFWRAMNTKITHTADLFANLRCSGIRTGLPLTEVQFNLERVGGELGFDGLKAEVDPNPKRFVNFDIFLNIIESKDGLVIDCDYNSGLFDQGTIGRWLATTKPCSKA